MKISRNKIPSYALNWFVFSSTDFYFKTRHAQQLQKLTCFFIVLLKENKILQYLHQKFAANWNIFREFT